MPTLSSRRKGAQPGNTNALKHGLYTSRFRRIQARDLAAVVAADLEDEIAGLRATALRILDEAECLEDPKEVLNALNMYGAQAMRIARLTQIKHMMTGTQDDSEAIISRTLARAMEELKIK
jgi:hypothetical protein